MIFRHLFNLFDACFFSFSSSYVFCMHVISFYSSEFHELSINSLFFIIFLFLQLCDDDLLCILFNESQIICFESTNFAFFIMIVKLSVSNRKRLRKNFFLFSFFCLVVCHICSFVFLKSELIIICLVLLMNSRNSFSRTESLHCMLSAILRSQWFFNSCWISVKSRVWRNNDNVSFVVSTCLLKCFNCLMHCFSLTDHISSFSKTCRMIDDLNVLFLIFVKSFKNCSIEYFTNDVTTTF
jgi:hypothetical protein